MQAFCPWKGFWDVEEILMMSILHAIFLTFNEGASKHVLCKNMILIIKLLNSID